MSAENTLLYLKPDGTISPNYAAFPSDSLLRTAKKPRFYSATGYGRKIPTQYKALCLVQTKPCLVYRLYRVYAIHLSNAPSFYILPSGSPVYLGV